MNYAQQNEFYFSYGITTIPCAGKKPLKNIGYQQDIQGPTAGIVPDYGTPDGLAALCGTYSNGLYLLDFDLKNAYGVDLFEEFMTLLETDNPRLKGYLVAFRTVSGGYKIPFFADQVFRTEVLAKNEEGKPTIEIQGEKALSMLPPSVGYDWVIGEVGEIPRLNQEEVEYLLSMARCYSEYEEPELPVYVPTGNRITGDSPLNKFDDETDYTQWMVSLGWKVVKANSAQVHLNRPEAKNKKGVDATIYRANKSLRIWSASSDLVPDIERSYKPSQLLVFTKYNGDFTHAAKDLALQYNLKTSNPNPEAAVYKLPVKPVKKQEHRFIPDNPALQLQKNVFLRKLEADVRSANRKGTSLTDVLFTNLHETNPDISLEEIKEFTYKYYEENEEEFESETKKFTAFEVTEKFINKNFVIRRNTVLFTTEILNRKDLTPTNYNIDSIWNTLQGKGIKVNRPQIVSLCNDPRVFQTYDPFEEYFTKLEFKGTGHIDKLSSFVIVEEGCQDFWKTMFRKALIRTVAGAIGEYPNREAIVLCSPKERIGKTQFVRFLCPWGPNKYYSDEPIVISKDQSFRVAQNLIYLIDEIGAKSVNEKMADYIKMLISKQTVNERRVYEVDTTNMNRKVTFWGTTNNQYLYKGENSRYISIPVVAINHNYSNFKTKTAEVEIDHVWAEAYKAYMDGEDFELTDEERDQQALLNNPWYLGSEATGLVDNYVRFSMDSWISAESVINQLTAINPVIVRRVTTRNIHDAMKQRNIPVRSVKNDSGYKVNLYGCYVVKDAMPETQTEKEVGPI
jgi:hypothetical protein